jgi:hypothetical protein
MTHHYREDETRTQVNSIKWAESISERTHQALRDLGWADPNDIEEIKSQISSSRATMLVNYGPSGRTRPNLITGDEGLEQMIVKVLSYYEDQCKAISNNAADKATKTLEALKEDIERIMRSRKGYIGDHYVYCPQLNADKVDELYRKINYYLGDE